MRYIPWCAIFHFTKISVNGLRRNIRLMELKIGMRARVGPPRVIPEAEVPIINTSQKKILHLGQNGLLRPTLLSCYTYPYFW